MTDSAPISHKALLDAARILDRYYFEKQAEYKAEYHGRVPTGYEEGFLDAIDICEQKIANLAEEAD